MKIVYVAKHDSGGNDDEGAITYSLRVLGHHVEPLREVKGINSRKLSGDFILQHHWGDFECMVRDGRPRVFWYFDLVDWPGDPSLEGRCAHRRGWMARMTELAYQGFCTDGDWAASHPALYHLFQGADPRTLAEGVRNSQEIPILFTGISRGGGEQRVRFVDWMAQTYPGDFHHFQKGVHGLALRKLVQSAKIVVAPNAPVTDRYWSNRVYLTLGFGGFLLHPYCAGLAKHYIDGQEIVFYRDLAELRYLIDYYLSRPKERQAIAEAGLARTAKDHTYIQRTGELIEVLKRKAGWQ